jgi:hypothetical protein
MPDFASLRRAKAASPAGCIRPCSVSSFTRAMFTVLQLLSFFRGVNRIL